MITTEKKSVSVIIPAYNEAAYIFQTIQETIRALDGRGEPYEIIVVDDGSQDATYAEALRACAGLPHVRAFRYERNAGKGHALLYGFRQAAGEIIVFLDADLELPPHQVPALIGMMHRASASVVVGSKRHPDSRVVYPLRRKVASEAYHYVVRALFRLPIRDTQTGIKAFKHEVLCRIAPRLLVRRYAFDLELLVNAHRLGYRIVEAPVTVHSTPGSPGPLNPRDVWKMWTDTLAVFYRLHVSKYYDRAETEA